MTGWQRPCWWGLGTAGAGAAVGLLVWMTAAHPDGAGQVWGAVGAVAGVAAVVVSLWQLRTAALQAPPIAPASSNGPMSGSGAAIVSEGSVRGCSTSFSGAPRAAEPEAGAATGAHAGGASIVSRGDVENSRTDYRS
ncbi:hypothetical protein OG365_01845 [Streptomyces sp. NBC_00853]|uniref:hypothetical protein n=1 Tax=Streptomyces sp. NBC_00853 TaxID=2903681 RepID=UPI00387306E5|nr:hypothetical protein OG365_01845 [Streptomyces sp. NBC_00853]